MSITSLPNTELFQTERYDGQYREVIGPMICKELCDFSDLVAEILILYLVCDC